MSPVGHVRAWGEMPGDPRPWLRLHLRRVHCQSREPSSQCRLVTEQCDRWLRPVPGSVMPARESRACASSGRPAPDRRWHRQVLGKALSGGGPGCSSHGRACLHPRLRRSEEAGPAGFPERSPCSDDPVSVNLCFDDAEMSLVPRSVWR